MIARPGWFSLRLCATFCFLQGIGYGQFSAAGSISTMYDDNIDNNHLQIADRIGQLSLDLEHSWASEQEDFVINYNGALTYFSEVVDRTFNNHSAGLSFERRLDEDGQSTLSLGTSYSLRLDRGEYEFYDHGQFALSGVLRNSFAERFRGQLSYSFRTLRFPELADFNYDEHEGALRLTTFLPTKTTIIVDGSIGIKAYKTTNALTATTGQMQGRRGRLVEASAPGVTQLRGLLRVGQSIADGTGLSLAGTYQTNLQKESRYLGSDFGVVSDDDLFDDHYGYEGLSGNLMVTQILFQDMTLRFTADHQYREYTGRPAYDLDGMQIADLRCDTRRSLAMQAEYAFPTLNFSIAVAFDYIWNESTDLFYTYTNNALTIALTVPY